MVKKSKVKKVKFDCGVIVPTIYDSNRQDCKNAIWNQIHAIICAIVCKKESISVNDRDIIIRYLYNGYAQNDSNLPNYDDAIKMSASEVEMVLNRINQK